MTNKTITQLDTAQSLNDNMVIPVELNGNTYKAFLAQIKSYCLPTGTINITTNGTYNVADYETAEVSVQPSTLPTYQITNGILSKPTGTYNLTGTEFSNVTSISSYGLAYAFRSWTLLTGTLDFSSLESIAAYGMYAAFDSCRNLTGTLDFSSLTTLGDSSLSYSFYNCQGITSVDLSSLTSISEPYAMYYAFPSCINLSSVDLSNLTSISGEMGLAYAFVSTNLATVNFTSLTNVSRYALNGTFYNCKALEDVYFNSLTTTSFSATNAFSSMLSGTGTDVIHTLHFPSNLETTIQGLSGYPLFGGTDGYVTLAFDLPATS